jgi:hypothetical protein
LGEVSWLNRVTAPTNCVTLSVLHIARLQFIPSTNNVAVLHIGFEYQQIFRIFPFLHRRFYPICLTFWPHKLVYWIISLKSTGGVTRDRICLFDISTTAEFLRDTLQNFDNLMEILCSRGGRRIPVTAWRFDQSLRDAWHWPIFDIDRRVRAAWPSIWMK